MFALELKEQLAQILAVFVTSILIQPLERLDAERAESPLRKIVKWLMPFKHVMRSSLCQEAIS
jgi:hypothetical protein